MAAKGNIPTSEEIKKAIAAWSKGLIDSKKAAQDCAVMALTHTYVHRNAEHLDRLLKVIESSGKDYVRRAPYTLWLKEFAPIKAKKTDDGQVEIVFDKESKLLEQQDDMIAKASVKNWWTMSKDVEPTAFDIVAYDAKVLSLSRKALNAVDTNDNFVIKGAEREFLAKQVTLFEERVAANKRAAA